MRLLHAGPDRLGDGPAGGDPAADRRGGPRGDDRQPLPLRRLRPKIERAILRAAGGDAPDAAAGQDADARWRAASRRRGSSSRRTTSVETWPDEAERLRSSARRAPRQDGGRAGGRRGPLHGRRPAARDAARAVLRAPFAHCRVTGLEVDAARAVPGVRAVIGPEGPLTSSGDSPLTDAPSVEYAGAPVAVIAADTPEAAHGGPRGARARSSRRWRRRPRGRARTSSASPSDPRGDRPRRRRRRARRGRRADRARPARRPATLQTPLEPHAAVAWWEGDELTAWVSTQGIFDGARRACRRFGLGRERSA